MTALVADAELPPKIGVHPRPDGSFAHAMPAHLRGADPDGAGDLLGIKWVAGFATNNERGLPAINAVVVLNDAATGLPTRDPRRRADHGPADGGGLGRRDPRISRPAVTGRAPRAALIGAGVQGHSHLRGPRARPAGRRADARSIATPSGRRPWPTPRGRRDGIGEVTRRRRRAGRRRGRRRRRHRGLVRARSRQVDDRRLAGAGCARRRRSTTRRTVAAEVAREAALFLVDDRGQFLANRDAGQFDGYPDPTATLGEAILAGTARPAAGRVVVTHLGVGLADVVFGAAIVRRAEALGLGTMLPR